MAIVQFFLLLVGFAVPIYASKCGITPPYVDIHKRQVNGTSDFVYGSFIGVGIPHQNQSLWPSILHNETYFAANDFCDDISPEFECNATTAGGMIYLANDTTFTRVDDYDATDLENSSGFLYGNDTVHLYQHFFQTDSATETAVTNTPITILEKGSFNQSIHDPGHWGGTVGLGPKSTLLQTLYGRNWISQNAVSLYVGTGFDRAGGDVNGSITFGGYDSSRFSGPVATSSLNSSIDGNPFLVHVNKITLNHPTGSGDAVELLSNDGTVEVPAVLSTEQYSITLPPVALKNFISATNAFSDNTTSSDDSLILPEVFKGTMTISLSNGLSITFPPEWVSNVSNVTPISSTPCSDVDNDASCEAMTLGTSFLSYVYLMISYETQSLHLSPAILDAPFISRTAWCPGATPTPYSHKLSPFVKSGAPGAILGGLLGGGAIIICALVLVRYILRKEQRKRKVKFFDGRRGGVKINEYERYNDDDYDGSDDDAGGGNSWEMREAKHGLRSPGRMAAAGAKRGGPTVKETDLGSLRLWRR